MEQQVVYWANLTELPDEIMTPLPLLGDIAKSQAGYKGGNHVACPAIRAKHVNTFFTRISYSLKVKFDEGQCFTTDLRVSPRQGLYESSFAFDWSIQRIFFSPISQIMEVSPPYLHKTSYSQFGHAPSGSFDIGAWFRPSSPTFQLWSGEKQFSAQEGEAHLYFNFPSEKRIVLKQFLMTPILHEALMACVSYKDVKPKQTMETMYNDFKNNGLRDIILKEIDRNIIK